MKILKKQNMSSRNINMLSSHFVRNILAKRGFVSRQYTGYLDLSHRLQPEDILEQHFHYQVDNQINMIKEETCQILNVHRTVKKRLENLQNNIRNYNYASINNNFLKEHYGINKLEHNESNIQSYFELNKKYLNKQLNELLNSNANIQNFTYNSQGKETFTSSNRFLPTHKIDAKSILIPYWEKLNSDLRTKGFSTHISDENSFIKILSKFNNVNGMDIHRIIKKDIVDNLVDERLERIRIKKEERLTRLNIPKRILKRIRNSYLLSAKSSYGKFFQNVINEKSQKNYEYNRLTTNDDLLNINNELYGDIDIYESFGSGQDRTFKNTLVTGSWMSNIMTKQLLRNYEQTSNLSWNESTQGEKFLFNRFTYLIKNMKHQHTTLQSYKFAQYKKQIRTNEGFVENVMNNVFLRNKKVRDKQKRKSIQNVLKKLFKDQRFFNEILSFQNTSYNTIYENKQNYTTRPLIQKKSNNINYKMNIDKALDTSFYNTNLMDSIGDDVKSFNNVYQMASEKELNRMIEHFTNTNNMLLNQELYQRFKMSNQIDTSSNQYFSDIHMDQITNKNPFDSYDYNTVMDFVDLNRTYDIDNNFEVSQLSQKTEARSQKEVDIYESLAKQKMLYQLKKTYEKNITKHYRSQFLDGSIKLQDRMTLFKQRMNFKTNMLSEKQQSVEDIPYRNSDYGNSMLARVSHLISGNSELLINKDVNYGESFRSIRTDSKPKTYFHNPSIMKYIMNGEHGDNMAYDFIQSKWSKLFKRFKDNGNKSVNDYGDSISNKLNNNPVESSKLVLNHNNTVTREIIDRTEIGYRTDDNTEIYRTEKKNNDIELNQITTMFEERFEKMTKEIKEIKIDSSEKLNVDKLSENILRKMNQRAKIERQRKGML